MPFTGYSYATGLGVLQNAVSDINKRAEKEAEDAKWGDFADKVLGPQATPTMTLGSADTSAAPQAPAVPAAAAAPVDLKAVPSFMQAAGQGVGIDPTYLARLAQVESAGDPNAHNKSGADGLFQFMPKTWAAQGLGGSPRDPQVASMAAANFTADNADKLGQALGREPTQGEVYLAHQQGAGGALALLKNPGLPAVDALAQVYGGDTRKAAAAIAQNGGDPRTMTAGDFASLWTGKFPNAPVRVASTDPSFTPAPAANPAVSPLALGGAASAGPAMQMPAAAVEAGAPVPSPLKGEGSPQLDPGSLYRLTEGAKVNPSAPAVAYASPNAVTANPAMFMNPDGSRKTAGEVVAAMGQGASAAPAGAPSGVPVQTATAAAPAPAGDAPVKVPGYDGTWTRASIAAAAAKDPTRDGVPEDSEFDAALKGAGGAPAGGGQAVAASAPGPVSPAAAQAIGLPQQIQPGSQLPAAVKPATTPEVRAMIGMMLRDPSTRAAGLQALMTLQTKQTASAPFSYQGGLFQYGADGSLHQVIAPKDSYTTEKDADGNTIQVNRATNQRSVLISNKDKTQLREAPDGSLVAVDTDAKTATPVTGLPSAQAKVWGQDIPVPPGYPAGTPGYTDAKGALHVGLTTGTDMAATQKGAQTLDGKIFDKIDGSYDKSQGAVGTLAAISRQKEAIDRGLVSGWGADWQTQARAAAAKLLGIDPSAVTNSEVFDAASTQKQAELAKAVSQAGHTTNMDLQLGKVIAGGDRSKTEQTLRSIVDAQETLARDQLARHNALVDKAIKLNPGWGDRLNVLRADTPEVYQYGQAQANRVSDPGAAAGPRAAAPSPASAPVKIPSNMTPDQVQARFPKGTPIILPDGRQGFVP